MRVTFQVVRNLRSVAFIPTCLQVLQVLVRMGAPPRILLDGKPHLGTDRLVRMLQQFRAQLKALGVSG